MMISKITINNFRTHGHTELNLSNGINVVVGLPDSGKTNIIRSLIWVLTNRPSGFRFHNDMSKESETSVKIDFQDRQWIEFLKSKKSAKYLTSSDNGALVSIGQDVPNSVSDIANMSDLNIQKQLDKHFLICSSPSEVAKTFNRITRLEKIDKCVSLLTSDINTQNKNIKSCKDAIAETQEKLDAIGDVKRMQDEADDINQIEHDIEKMEQTISDMCSIMVGIESLKCVLKQYDDLSDGEDSFEKIEHDHVSLDQQNTAICFLEKIINDIVSIDQKEFNKRSLVGLQEIEEKFDRINNCVEKIDGLSAIINICDSTWKTFNKSKSDLDKQAKEYDRFLKTVTICPFCERPWSMDQCK